MKDLLGIERLPKGLVFNDSVAGNDPDYEQFSMTVHRDALQKRLGSFDWIAQFVRKLNDTEVKLLLAAFDD